MSPRFSSSLQWLSSQQQRMAELLVSWSNINSGSHNPAGLLKQAEAILPLLRQLDPSARFVPLNSQPRSTNPEAATTTSELGPAILARSPNRPGPRVLLAIHFDTVFGPEHPFQTVTPINDKILRGPGVCDAKGGLLVLLFSLLALERSEFATRLNWEIILNPDEEIGSPASAELFESAATRNDLALLFEPALPDGALVSSRKGSGNFTFTAHGKSAHAGRNGLEGRNAIHALAALIARMPALQSEMPGVLINTGFISGGGPVNVVPDHATACVNVRVESEHQRHLIESHFRELASDKMQPDGIRIELHGGFHAPPKPLTPPTELLLQQLADCGKMFDLNITWRATGGACDGNRTAACGLPTIDSLGVRGGEIHTDREFVHLESLTERAALTALFLMRLAAGEFPISAASAPANQASSQPQNREVPT